MKKIGITIGDPSGIGPEIVVKALSRRIEFFPNIFPILFGHADILNRCAEKLQISINFIDIDSLECIDLQDEHHFYCFSGEKPGAWPPAGIVNKISGGLAYDYIRDAIDAAQDGKIDAFATAPINKEALRMADIPYLDHTDILAKRTGSHNVMTLFVTNQLRVFFYSRHIAFKEISASLTIDELKINLENCNHYLRVIGVTQPRIAVAALNPHGGENGMFGEEEATIIRPAVEKAVAQGLAVEGPIAADSVFHLASEGHYDAVLALYHDQGHIAAKTYNFHKTVSLTMGLPFLRTSVDHGTAMEMAGKNRANPTSMIEAIKAAATYCF